MWYKVLMSDINQFKRVINYDNMNPEETIKNRTSTGTAGNLNLDYINKNNEAMIKEVEKVRSHWSAAIEKLAGKKIVLK